MHWTFSGGPTAAPRAAKATSQAKLLQRNKLPAASTSPGTPAAASALRGGFTRSAEDICFTPRWCGARPPRDGLIPPRHLSDTRVSDQCARRPGLRPRLGRPQRNRGVSAPILVGHTESLPRKAAEQIYT